MPREIIDKALLGKLAQEALKDAGANDCEVFSVYPERRDADASPGAKTIDEIAPVWFVDFECKRKNTISVRIKILPDTTKEQIKESMIQELRAKL